MDSNQKILHRSKGIAQQNILDIIQSQNQNGSFELTEKNSKIIGIPFNILEQNLSLVSDVWISHLPEALQKSVIFTLLVLVFVHSIMKEFGETILAVIRRSLKQLRVHEWETKTFQFLSKHLLENEAKPSSIPKSIEELMVVVFPSIHTFIEENVDVNLFNPVVTPKSETSKNAPSIRAKFIALQGEWDPSKKVEDPIILKQSAIYPFHCHNVISYSKFSSPFQCCNGCDKEHSLQIDEEIGHGSYATVYSGTLWNTKCAVKAFSTMLSLEDQTKFLNELDIMSKLQHPNVIQILASSIRPPNYMIALEYASNGDLYSLIHDKGVTLEFNFCILLIQQISNGMEYVHQKDVIHRDLKPSNILLDSNWVPKIADFSVACIQKKSETFSNRTPVGTPVYMAPEVYKSNLYDRSIDVYSFSILFWETLTQKEPYGDEIKELGTWEALMPKIVGGHRPMIPSTFSSNLIELIQSCWSEDRLKRPSFQKISSLLSTTFNTQAIQQPVINIFKKNQNENLNNIPTIPPENSQKEHITNPTPKEQQAKEKETKISKPKEFELETTSKNPQEQDEIKKNYEATKTINQSSGTPSNKIVYIILGSLIGFSLLYYWKKK